MEKEEKFRLKRLFRKKNLESSLNSDAVKNKSIMADELKKLWADDKFYDVVYKDVALEGFKYVLTIKKEYTLLENTLHCITRANGKLESYEFLTFDDKKSLSYMMCKEFEIGKEDPSLTLANAGFCLFILNEEKGEFKIHNLQYAGYHIYDYDRNAKATQKTADLAHEAVKMIKTSQTVFETIKNTVKFQNTFESALNNGKISFSKRGGIFKNGERPNFALVLKFNEEVLDKPVTIYTPKAPVPFQIIDNKSKIYLPFQQVHSGLSDACQRISETDFIDLPIIVNAFAEDTKENLAK